MEVNYPTLQVLSRNLTELRIQEDWTKEELASKLNMSLYNYCQLEQGQLNIDLSTLSRIAALYNVEIPALFILAAYHYQVSPGFRSSYQQVIDRLSDLDRQQIANIKITKELLDTYAELQSGDFDIHI